MNDLTDVTSYRLGIYPNYTTIYSDLNSTPGLKYVNMGQEIGRF